MKQIRLLWLSPRYPWPADTGAKRATVSLLEGLVEEGLLQGFDIKLDAVFLQDTNDLKNPLNLYRDLISENKCLFQKIFVTKKSKSHAGATPLQYLKHFFGRKRATPFTVTKCQIVDKKVNDYLHKNTWDITILDGLHAAQMINLNQEHFGQVFYRAHNVESDLWLQSCQDETHFLKKIILDSEYKKVLCYEKFVVKKCESILYVSEVDQNRFHQIYTSALKNEGLVLPIGMNFENFTKTSSYLTDSKGTRKLLFVGRLDWHPNKQGLIWFLKEVWPRISKNNHFQLQIIGSGDNSWLDSYLEKLDHITLTANVPDLASYYKNSDLTLIPLFIGSGTRVKAIESASYGKTFIATSLGIAGLPIDETTDYLNAETATEWISALTTLDGNDIDRKAKSLHHKMASIYERTQVLKTLLKYVLKKF